ncbi:unnamed protein product [Calypogeia fissa]
MYLSFIIEFFLFSFLPGPSFSIGISKEISKGGENPLLDESEGLLDIDNIDIATQLLIDELTATDPIPNESGEIYEFLAEDPNFTRTVAEGGENRGGDELYGMEKQDFQVGTDENGVPSNVGMKISRHKTIGAYERYNCSMEPAIRAAQRAAGEGTSYEVNFKAEVDTFKNNLKGEALHDEDSLATNKKRRVMEAEIEGGNLSAAEPITVEKVVPELKNKTIASEGMASNTPVTGGEQVAGVDRTGKGIEASGESEITIGSCVKPIQNEPTPLVSIGDPQYEQKMDEFTEFLGGVDWNNLANTWPAAAEAMKPTVMVMTPINAVFGSMTNCNVSIHFNGPGQLHK